ncbi:MAG: hypothetical protein CBB87_06115 [Micavibrio sp. TMED27]|nr:carboxymuconolactone decarboxylase [Micavibrio sp.]OUT91587.1 MAG: hypothetical protein CBB87_06115 [Micavibrio sp. TMED27]
MKPLRFFTLTLLTGAITMTSNIQAKAQEAERLTVEQQHIISVAAYTANGDIDALKAEFSEALGAGLTVNEIKEVLIQMYAYAGFPRSLNGINAFLAVLDDRKEQGIEDVIGDDATPVPAGTDMTAYGNTVRNQLANADMSDNQAAFAQFAPVIDEYLKKHLFGEIFSRDVLDIQQRELATLGALASMDGTAAQLGAHINFSLNVGITQEQLNDFIKVIEQELGAEKAAEAKAVLDKITAE